MNSNPDFALSFLLDPTTVVCIAAGIVIVALYSMQKFAEPTPEKGEDNFIAQLCPIAAEVSRNERGIFSRADLVHGLDGRCSLRDVRAGAPPF